MRPKKGFYYGIYAIQCNANGKVYVGASTNPANRIRNHFYELRGYGKHCSKMQPMSESSTNMEDWQSDFDKYGTEGFTCFIIEDHITSDRVLEREEYYTNLYHSDYPGKGYNVKYGNKCKNFIKIVDGMPKLPEEH